MVRTKASPQKVHINFTGLNVRAKLEVLSDFYLSPVVLRCRQTFQSAMP